jgi:hypothetical protein
MGSCAKDLVVRQPGCNMSSCSQDCDRGDETVTTCREGGSNDGGIDSNGGGDVGGTEEVRSGDLGTCTSHW